MNPTQGMGFDPSSLIGSTSLLSTRQNMITTSVLLSMFQPGGINTVNMGSISAQNLASSTINGVLNVGTTNTGAGISIDGVNGRIISNDGTTNRMVFGNR